MAKRFGRNQRRRMREEVADLTKRLSEQTRCIDMHRMLLAELSEKLDRERALVERCRQAVGVHHIGMPAKTFAITADIERLVYEQGWFRALSPVYGNEPIECLALRMRHSSSDLAESLHFLVALGDGSEVRYVISKESLVSQSTRYLVEEIAPRIAKEIAIVLVEQAKEKFGKRGSRNG